MPTATLTYTYKEIQEAIALWLNDNHSYKDAKADSVRVIIDHGSGSSFDPGFTVARAKIGSVEVDLNYHEIRQALEYWTRVIKLTLVHLNTISLSEDRGGGTPLDPGNGITGQAQVKIS